MFLWTCRKQFWQQWRKVLIKLPKVFCLKCENHQNYFVLQRKTFSSKSFSRHVDRNFANLLKKFSTKVQKLSLRDWKVLQKLFIVKKENPWKGPVNTQSAVLTTQAEIPCQKSEIQYIFFLVKFLTSFLWKCKVQFSQHSHISSASFPKALLKLPKQLQNLLFFTKTFIAQNGLLDHVECFFDKPAEKLSPRVRNSKKIWFFAFSFYQSFCGLMKCSVYNIDEKIWLTFGKTFVWRPRIIARKFPFQKIFFPIMFLLTHRSKLFHLIQKFFDRSPKFAAQSPTGLTEIVFFSPKSFSWETPRKAWSAVLTNLWENICPKPENRLKK